MNILYVLTKKYTNSSRVVTNDATLNEEQQRPWERGVIECYSSSGQSAAATEQ